MLAIFAFAAVTLLLFVGLAVDSGSVYVTYGHLKRAVDASSVAAANAFKRNDGSESLAQRMTRMTAAANEELVLHNITPGTFNLQVYICDADGDNVRDASLQTTVPDFYAKCPDTAAGQSSRKLVWVQATQNAPLYFMQLIGFRSFPLTTSSIAEAAPLDVVIVMDISESMGNAKNAGGAYVTNGYVVGDYAPDNCYGSHGCDGAKPTGCNASNSCYPLRWAKDASNALLGTLYLGYDRASVVTFDTRAHTLIDLTERIMPSQGSPNVQSTINAIGLHDDPPVRFWRYWNYTSPVTGQPYLAYNPVNPEDRDQDGYDYDNPSKLGYTCPAMSDPRMVDRWWNAVDRYEDPDNPGWLTYPDENAPDPYNWGGVPCDDDNKLDAYNFDGSLTLVDSNSDGIQEYYDSYSDNDDTQARIFLNNPASGDFPEVLNDLSPLSTCTGCGIREASKILRNNGRPGAVWVIIFLSDGAVNLSDTHYTNTTIPAAYTSGYCGGGLNSTFWKANCMDRTVATRYCIDKTSSTCPPGATWQNPASIPYNSLSYSALDYALDMVDETALTKSTNGSEPAGNDIAIYVIGVGQAGDTPVSSDTGEPIGEKLLRYMANIGDDGSRSPDPCAGVAAKNKCGNYYYTSSGTSNQFLPIFEDIAGRIYTRIRE